MNFNKKSYEDLSLEISKSDYNKLDKNQKVYYSEECFHKKKSKEEINHNTKNNSIINEKIKKNYKKEINQSEYDKLNETEKEQYQKKKGLLNSILSKKYIKIQNLKNTLSYRVTHNEKILLTQGEYNKLGKNAKALGWVRIYEQVAIQEWITKYRRRLPEDTALDLVLDQIKKKELEINTLLKKGIFHKTGRYIRKTLPNYSIQTNRNEYYTLTPNSYANYIKLGEELKELQIKRAKI